MHKDCHSLSDKEENKLPADLRYTIYCTTVANGKDSDWLFLWNRYRDVQDSPSEKKNLLGALCCSTEIWTLQVPDNLNKIATKLSFHESGIRRWVVFGTAMWRSLRPTLPGLIKEGLNIYNRQRPGV